VPSPDGNPDPQPRRRDQNQLLAAAHVSSDDGWAIGCFYENDGFTQRTLIVPLGRACCRSSSKPLRILTVPSNWRLQHEWRLCRARHKRHTFCSHLAMRNAPPLAIQQLAGHTSLRTTLRYMHLSPAEKDRAIRLLDEGRKAASAWRHTGDAAASVSKSPLPQGVN
jgi:hypothetical protein